jgi:hypothetical protein
MVSRSLKTGITTESTGSGGRRVAARARCGWGAFIS